MYCVKCGNRLSQGAKFCGNCGISISPQSDVNVVAVSSNIGDKPETAKGQTNWKLIARRILIFIATTALWIIFGYFISATVGGTVAQNAATTALALLVGCFSISAEKRQGLSDKLIAILFLIYIPLSFIGAAFSHDAILRDPQSMAKTGQLIYSVILAVITYQIAGSFSKRKKS